jgi:hypothetical protein
MWYFSRSPQYPIEAFFKRIEMYFTNPGNGAIMKQYRVKLFMVSSAAAIYLLTAFSALADVERVYGKAVNADGDLVFLEEHIVRYEDDRIAALKTIYYDADLKKIGEQASDFSHGPQFGSYDFTDERLRYNDGARVMSNRILIYCKETPRADIQKKYLKRESNQIVGQGFHQFILANFDALMLGDVITAKLVLPAHMDQFDIRILKNKIEADRLQIRIELDNWFLRLFTPRVEAEYDLDTRRLISYQGLSMIANASGKNEPVTVFYDYSQQSPLASTRF